MQCTKPITAWYGPTNSNGKRGLVFKKPATSANRLGDLQVPCRRCMDCRLEYSRQWAVRCIHEAQLHDENCFITLTYDNSNLPDNGTLVKKDLQNFYKRLRKKLAPKKIRHYSCGEYGDESNRPHYHAVIFGHTFTDGVIARKSSTGDLYYSDELIKIWGKGLATYGNVTFESAAYVARYATKKINGDLAEEHYKRVDPETGEIVRLDPEFATMSLKPGIADEWFKRFKTDCFPSDEVIVRGKKSKPPKFYDIKLEKEDPDLYKKIKDSRVEKARKKGKASEMQLAAHEKITCAKLNLKKGDL
jgi:hypothetical protein